MAEEIEEEIEFEPVDLQEEAAEEEEETEEMKKKKYPYPYKEKLSEYTEFVKKFLKEHEGASIKDAAKAWKKEHGLSEELDANDYEAILMVVEELRKKKKKYPYPEEAAKKKYPNPYEEKSEKQLDAVAQAIEEIKKQYEAMNKKIEQLENKPVRISQTTVDASDVNARVQKFLSELTAGEMLVYAEKRGIKWGEGHE